MIPRKRLSSNNPPRARSRRRLKPVTSLTIRNELEAASSSGSHATTRRVFTHAKSVTKTLDNLSPYADFHAKSAYVDIWQ